MKAITTVRQSIASFLAPRPGRDHVGLVRQQSANDCGLACLSMVMRFHGVKTRVDSLAASAPDTADGLTVLDLVTIARGHGFDATAYRLSPDLLGELPLPLIAHWNPRHYIVVERVSADEVMLADPATGRRWLSPDEFAERFSGVAVAVTPRGR